MTGRLVDIEPVVSSERPRIWRYTYAAGPVRSRFLIELRDNKKILGNKCPECNRVYAPARPTCINCFSDITEYIEVGPQGTLLTYTKVEQPEPTHPLPTPFAYGIIQLDGADTGLVHIIGKVDLESLSIGMRVEAVFKQDREGNIQDIAYFKPLSS